MLTPEEYPAGRARPFAVSGGAVGSFPGPAGPGRPARVKGDLVGADSRVYDAIFEDILAQRLPPGTRLVESAIGLRLGVPRAVVRMGLLRLAHDRIVERVPNRGCAVARPGPDEARHLFEARRLLEGGLAAGLAGQLGARALATLSRLIARGQAAFEAGDSAGWLRAAADFHNRLAALAGNPVLESMVRELVTRSMLISALSLEPGRTRYVSGLRAELLAALAQGDAPGQRRARRLMEKLLTEIESGIEPRAG
ncbi:MAG: GntR family transcriptional regulator [Burkholderiales bacterium]|nr:GntR family transcriptional regulator [Burkholderiales bacterium]